MTRAHPASRPLPLIIGIGNLQRGDDGVGIHVARRLKAQLAPPAAVIECTGEGAELMRAWENADRVILIDAVWSGAPPGQIRRMDAKEVRFSGDLLHSSTHNFGLADAIEMARVLDSLPRRLIVYGIEGHDFSSGVGLSTPVSAAADEAIAQILSEIGASETACREVTHA